MSLADIIVVLREGRIEDHGPPDRLYLRPSTRFAATFMGDSNLVDGTARDTVGERVDVETKFGTFSVPGRANRDAAVTLAIRPEHLRADDTEGFQLGEGRVVDRHFIGAHQRCRVALENTELILNSPAKPPLAIDQIVRISADLDDFVLLES